MFIESNTTQNNVNKLQTKAFDYQYLHFCFVFSYALLRPVLLSICFNEGIEPLDSFKFNYLSEAIKNNGTHKHTVVPHGVWVL